MFKKLAGIFSPGFDFKGALAAINALEPEIQKLSDQEILEESRKLKEEIQGSLSTGLWSDDSLTGSRNKKDLDVELVKALPRAFALVREAAKRALNQRHFDVQLMGGLTLHQGKIAEMRTGEGKTLAATLPAYLNALAGKGVHVVTVNEYLAKRDTVWMGQIYHLLGLKVACLIHEGALMYDPTYSVQKPETRNPKPETNSNVQKSKHDELDKNIDTTSSFFVHGEFLRPISRKEAYEADITYGTNHEFGFDYLRDNLAHRPEDKAQRRNVNMGTSDVQNRTSDVQEIESAHYFAIIDEVDSILIDEARTPLIISAPDAESSQFYKTFARLAVQLKKDADYLVDEKMRSVDITADGIDKVEKTLNLKNLYAPENLRLTHYLQESLRAKELYLRDRDYVVKNGEIIIVDQFTGRLMLGRRYSGGLHQAIEAKENVAVQQESRTYASISIQNYFRLYKKLAGMTGTAQTSAEEFHKVYNLEVVTTPTHKPMIREDLPDLIYKTSGSKHEAIIKDIKERHEKGQPILIGTVSIEKNEELARELTRAGLKYEILNAKNNEREGAIIAQAGRPGAITVATNMAGRGVDIILGGNPPNPEEAQKGRKAGGLHVIGTERHESRRIDNQLRGRAGRQGDPGSSQFFLSLEDDLMRIFGGERIKNLMQTLKMPEDMPIQAGMINKVISQAQSKVEGMNFDARKHLLEYDDVLNKQRIAIYKKREEILEAGVVAISHLEPLNRHSERSEESQGKLREGSPRDSQNDSKSAMILSSAGKAIVLQMLDFLWMSHLENMEALQESVRLRAYGQHDPLVEYRREGHIMFRQLLADFERWVEENQSRINANISDNSRIVANKISVNSRDFASKGKIGRNEPCPCGAKHSDGRPMKYKKCHGKNG